MKAVGYHQIQDRAASLRDWLPPARHAYNPWIIKTILRHEEEINKPSDKVQPLNLYDGRTFWVAEDANSITFWYTGLCYTLDLSHRRGEVQISGEWGEQNILRVLYFLDLFQLGGLLLHASGVVRDGLACVFPGVSGAGKTTIVRLAQGMPVLNDELCAVYWSENEPVLAYGTPFYGAWGQPGEKLPTRIRGLFFPEQHADNRLTRLTPQETLTRLLPCVCTYTTYQPRLEKLINLSVQLVERVPGYLLHFRQDPSFWEVIDAA